MAHFGTQTESSCHFHKVDLFSSCSALSDPVLHNMLVCMQQIYIEIHWKPIIVAEPVEISGLFSVSFFHFWYHLHNL